MKECPRCFVCEDDEHQTCPFDGVPLAAAFPGSRVLDGKYRLERRMGEGGMGRIYRARHLGLHRTFALKLIQPTESADPTYLVRFRLEAEALGRLKHPNIVDITDFGIDPREGGLPYLVMEHLEGMSLADRRRSAGHLELDEALPILDAVARAVDFAHSNGVLHRDLKPANVFLSTGASGVEVVKVLDFGIAKLLTPGGAAEATAQTTVRFGADPDRAEPPAPAGVTQTGALVGSVPYVPPEALRGEPPTTASDIYSLGVLAFEVLAGRTPFQGAAREVLVAHLRETPPLPSELRDSLPKQFDAPLLKSLAKAPEERHRHGADLIADLRSACARAALARWYRAESPRRIGLAVLGGLVLTVASALLWRSSPVEALERKTIDARFLSLPPKRPDPRLLLVSIDDATLQADRTPLSQKADEFGRDLDRAFGAGARAVAVDLLLPEAWSHSEPFSSFVLHHASTLTLAALSSPSGDVVGPECVAGLTAAALGPQRTSELFGAVNIAEDSDGVVRRARLFFRDQTGGERAAWSAQAARTLAAPALLTPRHAGGGSFWIDYAADRSQLSRLSWKDLASRLDQDPRAFSGRLLLVGGDFAGGGDDAHLIPHRAGAEKEIPGLVLQALIVNTLLEGAPIREVSSASALLLSGLAAGAVVFGILWSRRVSVALIAGAAAILAYGVASILLFRRTQTIVPTAGPIVTIGLAALAALVTRRVLPRRPDLKESPK